MSAIARLLLPLPDSPMMPTASPGPSTANDTPSTARTGPRDVGVVHRQVLDPQQRHHDCRRSRGLTMGSMASDRSMNVTAVRTISSPGATTHHQ